MKVSEVKKWEKFSDEQLSSFVLESYSFRQLAEKCGYQKDGGSSIMTVRLMCEQKGFDTSHFSNKLRKEDVNIENTFKRGYKNRETLKKNLIALRGHKCECCQHSKWNEEDIPLQLHHRDGDGLNNLLENLQLLCPNCHAQTDTYCGKNKSKKITDEKFIAALKDSENIHQAIVKVGSTDGRLYERAYTLLSQEDVCLKERIPKEKKCLECGEIISNEATYCSKCYHISLRKTERPSREQLKEMIRNQPFTEIAKQFGVSDNAIRKWCSAMDLPSKKSEIKKYSKEEWEKI